MDVRDIGNLVIYFGTVAGALLAIGVIARWAVLRPLKTWLREQIQPPLRRIDAEISPNDGTSMRDAVNRIEVTQAALTARLNDHLRNHPGSS